MFKDSSVAKKRVVLLGIAVTVIFFGKIFYDIHADHRLALSVAEQQAKGLASALNEHALRTFNDTEGTIDSMIRSIAAVSATGIPDEKELQQVFASHQRVGSVMATLFVASPKGSLHGISTEFPVRPLPVTDREYFRHHSNSRDPSLFISKPFRNRLDNQWLITATKRLSNPDGTLRMIVGVAIKTRYFSSFYSTLGMGRNDRILLIRSDGAILALEPFTERVLLANLYSPEHARPELRNFPGSGTYQLEKSPVDSTDRIISYRSSAAYPVIAVISLDQNEHLGQWRARAAKDLAGAGLLVALAASLVLLVLRQLASLRQAKVAEEALRLSEQRFRELLENINLVSIILDTSGKVTFCNDYLLQLTGWSRAEVIGADWFDLFLPQQVQAELRALFQPGFTRGEIPAHYENPIVTREGDQRIISWDNTVLHHPDGALAGIASIGRDMTQHRALEDQLRQSQKMEATGLLAGGIAHDFNNILTVIIGYCSIMQMRLNPEDPNRVSVDRILAAAERAAGLTGSLLAFSRKQIMNPHQVDLNAIVRHVEHFLCRIIGEDITLRTDLHGEGLYVQVDSGQIEQIMMNLATNARDAMPNGGILSITTQKADPDPALAGDDCGSTGRYALLTISDNGFGMDEQTRAKIFEPFFTTKEVGKGTGLGLAMTYGTVMQHNGRLSVESEPGQGASFRIYLPLVAYQEPVPRQEASPFEPHAGHELILVAEDEPAVRELVEGILTRFGYRVLLACDGEDAVAKFRLHRDEIELVLLDMIMPKQSGKAAYDEISRLKPGVRVIFTSGYTADVIRSKGELSPEMELVVKPVHPLLLLRKVRELLDR
jgi:PAS domain S-box-containing protein